MRKAKLFFIFYVFTLYLTLIVGLLVLPTVVLGFQFSQPHTEATSVGTGLMFWTMFCLFLIAPLGLLIVLIISVITIARKKVPAVPDWYRPFYKIFYGLLLLWLIQEPIRYWLKGRLN